MDEGQCLSHRGPSYPWGLERLPESMWIGGKRGRGHPNEERAVGEGTLQGN